MEYLLGILWCILFSGLGVYLILQGRKYSAYSTFIAKVQALDNTNGKHIAILHSGIQEIGEFSIEFQDTGDFYEGDSIECMWDGKQPDTAQQYLWENQKLGIIFSFIAVAVMVVIIVATLIF